MNVRLLARVAVVAAAYGGVPAPGDAQGFAGMGTDAEGFADPVRGRSFEFPADHGPHPEYRIEWWYLTANLTGADGAEYGLQWTLFRSALAPERADDWSSPQIWIGHAGLTTADHHFSAERTARDGIGQAGVSVAPFSAWIDDWHMTAQPDHGGDALDRLDLHAAGADFGYELSVEAQGPLVFHGDAGYSVKSQAGQASYYYSQPHYRAEGTLRLPDGEVAVTGAAWLDREWSSRPLAPDQQGWDWFSLHFDDGARMMGFQLRDAQDGRFTYATWIDADGRAEPVEFGALSLEPLDTAEVAGRSVPVRWRLRLPGRGLDITAAALNPRSWMDTVPAYWEGPVHVTGSHSGRGYLEMTGYE